VGTALTYRNNIHDKIQKMFLIIHFKIISLHHFQNADYPNIRHSLTTRFVWAQKIVSYFKRK